MQSNAKFAELNDLLSRLCDGEMNRPDWDRLETLLLDDPTSQDYYRRFVVLDVDLAWRAGGRSADLQFEPTAHEGAAVELSRQLDLEPRTPNPESPVPTLSTTKYPLPTTPFIGSWAFSYMVATVVMGVAILGFWAYKITHHQHIAEAPSQSVPSGARPEMVFVGRITGMVDVKWSDDPRYLPPPGFAHVPLGRKYILDTGLMEITYDSGAKVILEGPCTYEVESTAGGYLSLGKLTARVGEDKETRRQGNKEKKADAASPHLPVSPSPGLPASPLFSVRTPTAIVTDLGTEFGVEVDESGGSKAHVFQGKVEVRLTGGGGETRAIQLGANESARAESGADRIVVVHRAAVQPNTFTRQMPRRVPIKLFNMGMGLKEGDEDPHWQLVARGDDPNFQPRPAVVTAAHAYWLANYPARSQWLSTADGPPAVPNVTYTFRTTFELAGALPETAVLRGRFIADNHVQAIRLNGKEVPVSEHGWGRLGGGIFSDGDAFNQFIEFSARKGFVEGGNTLEIDVLNGIPPETGGNGAMGLRVELSGHVLSSWQSSGRGQPPRKEGASMNGP